MSIRFDTVIILLSIVFIFVFASASGGRIDLGPYSKTVVVVLYFTLFSTYDQFKRPYKQRNYILLFGLLAAYLGALLAFLFGFGWPGVWWGGSIFALITVLLLWFFRKQFYAKLDKMVGKDQE